VDDFGSVGLMDILLIFILNLVQDDRPAIGDLVVGDDLADLGDPWKPCLVVGLVGCSEVTERPV
jgi:hypothetical protein